MAITNTAVVNGSAANIYASSGESVVVTLYVANYTASAVSANVYLVPASGTAGTNNIIIPNLQIAAYDSYIMNTERLVLGSGDMIKANANTGSALTATVSYKGS
jgi:hypothetical protein